MLCDGELHLLKDLERQFIRGKLQRLHLVLKPYDRSPLLVHLAEHPDFRTYILSSTNTIKENEGESFWIRALPDQN